MLTVVPPSHPQATPLAYLRAIRPTLDPMPLQAGDLVAVWPHHPTHELARLAPGSARILAQRGATGADPCAALWPRIQDGTLRPLSATCARHLAPSAAVATTAGATLGDAVAEYLGASAAAIRREHGLPEGAPLSGCSFAADAKEQLGNSSGGRPGLEVLQ